MGVFLCSVMLLAAPAVSANVFELQSSLQERAKWKSFGVEDWTQFDPLERALPGRTPIAEGSWELPVANGSKRAQLKALIAHAEAGAKGYDAVHVSARIKTPKRPTQMTLGQIRDWTRRTPGQPHAIGRYQFIPSTLAMLRKRAGLPLSTRFTPQVQDQLADLLLADAGWDDYARGRISQRRFMDNLALIWAGLPRSNGRSAYHGYAGNRATISLAFYRSQMTKIFSN